MQALRITLTKWRVIVIIILSFTMVGCGAQCDEPTFLYEPSEFDGNCFIVVESLMTEVHFDRVEKVLRFYEVEYERISNLTIMFKKGLPPELMYNYTSKAEDNAWLIERKLR